nr:MAG TPA: hypothetical protein [Caudoviricetes sp.]
MTARPARLIFQARTRRSSIRPSSRSPTWCSIGVTRSSAL